MNNNTGMRKSNEVKIYGFEMELELKNRKENYGITKEYSSYEE